MNLPTLSNVANMLKALPVVSTDIAGYGTRFNASKYARPYRHKNRKFLTNFRSGNKKKLNSYK